MKVTVGLNRFSWRHSGRDGSSFEAWKAVQASFSDAVTHGLIAESRDAVVETSPGMLKKLVTNLEAAANREADKMFKVIVQIIDRPRRSGGIGTPIQGITTSMMQYGRDPGSRAARGKLDFGQGMAAFGGSVPWRQLSLHWVNQKAKRSPSSRDKFFIGKTGRLREQLDDNGLSYMREWFGGVKVTSDYAASTKRGGSGKRVDANVPTALADVQIHVFPKVAPTLFPGLASRRWNDVDTDGRLERRVVKGELMRRKLINGFVPYKRPLLQPVAQFWIMYRIPAVIRTRLQSWIRNQSGENE